MASFYRCYLLNEAKKIKAVETFECDQDADALIKAGVILESQISYPFAEVWSGIRVVGELRRP